MSRSVALLLVLSCGIAGEAPPISGGSIAPLAATACGSQACHPGMAIDGSGLREDPDHPGVFTHLANRWGDAGCMWASNGEPVGKAGKCWLRLDLGRVATVNGLHLWNYNESGGWQNRGIKIFLLQNSEDDKTWSEAGSYELRCASGTDGEAGQAISLAKPIKARYLKLIPTAHYGRDNLVGLSEVRVRVTDPQPEDRVLTPRPPFREKYARPRYPTAPAPARAGDIIYPADARVVDVTKAPYEAKPDGTTDCTAALQRALDDHPNAGAVIWLPHGVYRISATLRWPHGTRGGAEEKNTILRGQSERGSIIRLDDGAKGFADPRAPKPVIWTGQPPAQRFANEIADLTVDTGSGNPGCSGVEFTANNQGVVRRVTIVSGDGRGVSGLNLTVHENGPLLIKHVTVQGFDVGIDCGGGINSQTLEHITVRHQQLVGLRNLGQPLSIRGFLSENDVPAIVHKAGLLVLLDARCTGTGAASAVAAVQGGGSMLVRDLTTRGYARALSEGPAGATVAEYASRASESLFPSSAPALRLQVEETPDPAWDPLDEWVSPLAFGGKPDDDGDDTAAIQAAVDAGKRTVYLPRGNWRIDGTVILRGKVARFIGCRANLDYGQRDTPVLVLADGEAPAVRLEHLSAGYTSTPTFDNRSKRAMVIAHGLNIVGRFTGSGPVFIEDVCSNPKSGWHFAPGSKVWARQMNVENEGLHIDNEGASLWILGYKTERGGTLISTRAGGATEVLGGFSYTTSAGKLAPMFVINGGRLVATFGEVCFNGDPYRTIISETRGSDTRQLPREDPRFGGGLLRFSAGAP